MTRQIDKSRSVHHSGVRAAEARVETRSGIIWQILSDQRLCMVKVQPLEDEIQIPAHYPETWRDRPEWCKVGAAVTIRHISGHRNRLEVIGPGLTIPTPALGAAASPTLAAGENCVIEGCELKSALDGLHVYFELGRYRINDVYYDLPDNWEMGDTPNLEMSSSSPIQMGNVADVFEVSEANSTLFRIDAWYVGIDGEIDYVLGVADATNPQIPDGPAAHVKMGHLLVPPGGSVATDLINKNFSPPQPAFLDLDVEKTTLAWADSSISITVELLDQYFRPHAGSWTIGAKVSSGTGSINSSVRTNGGSTAIFTYRRESPQGEEYETGPVYLDFWLVQNAETQNSTALVLEDELGGMILG